MKWLSNLRRETPEESGPAAVAAENSMPNPAGPNFTGPNSTGPNSTGPNPTGTEFAAASTGVSPPGPPPVDASVARSGGEQSAQCGNPPAASETPAGEIAAASAPAAESLEAPVDFPALLETIRAELTAGQAQLRDDQQALNELFATRLRSDEAQGRAVERLYDELRQYKTNFVRQQILPLLKEVIFCHDFLTGQIERLAVDGGAADPAAARQMLTDLLFKYDVEPYRSEADTFDPKQQQCTRTIPTGRSELDKTIAARGLEGFRSENELVRREQVSVYKFTPGAE
jgi:hypothetical protein